MNALLFVVQWLAWPSCVVACVWIVTRAAESYVRLIAAEYRDETLTRALATAERAEKTARKAQDDWIEQAGKIDHDIGTLKTALTRSME